MEPDVSIVDYAARTRADGLPVDAWLRVHARLGGVIDRVDASVRRPLGV